MIWSWKLTCPSFLAMGKSDSIRKKVWCNLDRGIGMALRQVDLMCDLSYTFIYHLSIILRLGLSIFPWCLAKLGHTKFSDFLSDWFVPTNFCFDCVFYLFMSSWVANHVWGGFYSKSLEEPLGFYFAKMNSAGHGGPCQGLTDAKRSRQRWEWRVDD